MGNSLILLEYNGHLTFSTIGRLLTQLKNKVTDHGIKIGVYKRMISVMIEALENVYKYSEYYAKDPFIAKNHAPEFILEKVDSIYKIHVSNPVKKEDTLNLSNKLEMVNRKNTDELKLLYRSTICNGKFSSKGGAGLGIIEMAKISGKPLQYSFQPINEDYYKYSLTVLFA